MARPKGKTQTVYAAFRIPAEVGQLWEDTAKALSLNKTATLVLALRRLARAEGVKERPLDIQEGKEEDG